MDGSNWKRILLHWVNQTGLFERPYYNIEQTDVEVFFGKFRSQMKTTPIGQTDLVLFLKEKYPEFEVHLNDDGSNLSSTDYMYVYSLLLHYSCVKCPETFFHEVCQSLPEQFQQAIAGFFKMLIESENFNRETLRHAIHTSSPKSPLRFLPLESPIRTPRSKISPPTPKTTMLEERTKELNQLKAQLESEKYEKGFLELLLKQNEEKIQKLSQEQKNHLAEIYNLKNDLLVKNTENRSPNKNYEEEQVKKRLRKNIAEKEEIILNLRENLESLGEEKTLLLEKLAYAENQVVICLDKIKEMDYIINELKSEIEKRDLAIQTLTETKNELELFIRESRYSSQNGRCDLNVSAECLDVSLTRTSNSSGSIASSPENLGVSVIDVKLREKENENVVLLEHIEQIKGDCKKLSKHVYELIIRYADTFDICNENLVVADDADLTHTFMVFENYIEKIIESYKMSTTHLNTMREDNSELKSQNEALIKRISELDAQLSAYSKQLELIQSDKADLERKTELYATQSLKHENDIQNLNERRHELETNLNKLSKEYEEAKKLYDEKTYQLTAENFKIESQLNGVLEEVKKLKGENVHLEVDKRMSEEKIRDLDKELEQKSKKIHEFEESNGHLLTSVATHIQQIRHNESKISELENGMEKLELAIEMLNEEKNVLMDENVSLRGNLDETKDVRSKLESEYKIQVQRTNQLKGEITRLEGSLAQAEVELHAKSFRNNELEASLAETSKIINDLKATTTELTESRNHWEQCCHDMKENIQVINAKLAEKDILLVDKDKDHMNYQKNKENEMKKLKGEFNAKLLNYENKIRDYNSQIDIMQKEKNEIQSASTDKNEEVKRLNVALERIKEQKTYAEEQFKNEKLGFEIKNEMLSSKVSEAETGVMSLLKLISSSTEKNSGDGPKIDYQSNDIDEMIKYLKERISKLIAVNNELSLSEMKLRSVIADLKDQLSELRKSSEELHKISNNMTEEITQYESRVQTLETDKNSLINVVAVLKKELQDVKYNKELLEKDCSQSQDTIKQLHKTVDSLLSEKISLSNDVSLLKTKEENLVEKVTTLLEEMNARYKTEEALITKLDAAENNLTEITAKHVELENELKQRENFITSLKDERDAINAELKSKLVLASEESTKLTQVQNENRELVVKINKLNDGLEKFKMMESELNVLKDECGILKKQLKEKEKSLETALKDISASNDSIAILKANQETLEKAAIDREVKLSELQNVITSRDLRFKEVEESVADKNAEIEQLKAQLANLELIIKEKEARIEEWCKLLASADAESKVLSDKYKETVESLETRINILDKERSTLEVSNKSLKDNLIEIEESLKHAQSVNVELLSKVDELKSSSLETTQRETDYINLQLRYVSLKAERDQLFSSKQKLEENCTKLTKRVEKLSVKLGDLQANAAKLERYNNESRNEIESFQKIIKQNNLQIEDLQTRLSTSQNELKAANEEVSNLKKACNVSAAKNNTLETEVEQLRVKLEESSNLQRDLKESNERAANLQKLYNEEVAKTVALNFEMQQIRMQLEHKQSELESQNMCLTDLKCDVENKAVTIENLNAEFGNLKEHNEELREENKVLTEKVQILSSVESKWQETEKLREDLERQNSNLQARLDELLTTEKNLKEATSHIGNIKQELELKVRELSTTLEKMTASLESAQMENTSLQSENIKLIQNFDNLCNIVQPVVVKIEENESDQANRGLFESKYNELVYNIEQLNSSKQEFQKENVRLASELETSQEENSQLTDKLSKLSIRLQILEKENVELGNEVKDLKTACDAIRSEKQDLEHENEGSLNCLQVMESRQNEIIHEHVMTQNTLKEQLARYEIQLSEKTNIIDTLEGQLQEAKNDRKTKAQEYATQTEQFQQLENQCRSLEQQIQIEREQNEKLKKDIAIFQAKLFKNRQLTDEKEKQWQEERSKLKEEIRTAENRIKDNRLELEGKLEKMKNKMKSLYNEEVTKIKNKHEREVNEYKTQVEELTIQNKKYEAHVQKLAKHVFNQNESILELQKQNVFMETRLKDLESIPASTLHRQSQFASQIMGSNLRMEDEEGEMFNNTYLADLKSGRMSPFGRDSVSVHELHYRNSLAPPHLRSTYIAQYPDHHLREEDIKDVPINLDDSLSSLLHAGQRKKMSGTTSYKKPGPPTPSKNGGRLSFGGVGSGDPPREILKESNDISVTNSKKATPSKFRNMFSSSRLRDENTPPKRRLSNLFQRKK